MIPLTIGKQIFLKKRKLHVSSLRYHECKWFPSIKYWQKIWKQHTRRITMFKWLLIYKSLPVGAWQRGNLSSPNCVVCPNAIESIRHALWDCPETHQIWRGVAHLLQLCEVQGTIKVGKIYVGYHGRPQLRNQNS